jgi:urease accessory protein
VSPLAPGGDVASADHGNGLLELAFRVGSDGRTVLAARRQRFPLRLTVPLELDPALPEMAFLYVQNPTGGVFAGDRLVTRIDAGPGTRLHLTTPSATRAYRMEGGHAEHVAELSLGPGSYLESLPEALIPQRGSRYVSRTAVQLREGAAYVGAELVAPGRHGESFAYDLLELETAVGDAAGQELCVDRVRLEPARRRPSSRGLLGEAGYFGTLIAVADGHDGERLAAATDRRLAELPGVDAAAGALPSGVGVLARVLGSSPALVRRAIDTAWAEARRALLGAPLPPRRK